MPGDSPFTFRALKVSMNFSSSSGGRKSPMKCLPRPIFVSCSAHSAGEAGKVRGERGQRPQGREAAGDPDPNPAPPGSLAPLLLALKTERGPVLYPRLCRQQVRGFLRAHGHTPHTSGLPPQRTPSLIHLHAPQLVLPGAQLAVHLLVTVVAVLVLLQRLLPQQLHVLHCSLMLHDHVIHLLHLWAARQAVSRAARVQGKGCMAPVRARAPPGGGPVSRAWSKCSTRHRVLCQDLP